MNSILQKSMLISLLAVGSSFAFQMNDLNRPILQGEESHKYETLVTLKKEHRTVSFYATYLENEAERVEADKKAMKSQALFPHGKERLSSDEEHLEKIVHELERLKDDKGVALTKNQKMRLDKAIRKAKHALK